jgi:hypothetical protein
MYRLAKSHTKSSGMDVPLIPLFVSMALLTQQYDPEVPFALQCIRASGYYRYSEDIELFLLKAYLDRKCKYNFSIIMLIFSDLAHGWIR